MIALPLTDDLAALSRRLIWFEEPDEAMSNPIRFLAYAFERATHADMALLRRHLTEAEFIEALDHAPPGIITPRSWAYWNARLGRYPPPAMPVRRLL